MYGYPFPILLFGNGCAKYGARRDMEAVLQDVTLENLAHS
jgi:hypothetical protein